jgi:hypothetical protein
VRIWGGCFQDDCALAKIMVKASARFIRDFHSRLLLALRHRALLSRDKTRKFSISSNHQPKAQAARCSMKYTCADPPTSIQQLHYLSHDYLRTDGPINFITLPLQSFHKAPQLAADRHDPHHTWGRSVLLCAANNPRAPLCHRTTIRPKFLALRWGILPSH